jgi:hypothetical protein
MAMSDEQEAAGTEEREGTIVRAANGDLYFLRPETLDACRITEPEMKAFSEKLLDEVPQDDVQGFTLTSGSIVQSTTFRGPFSAGGVRPGGTASYTSMCNGTMAAKTNQFRVINPATR